jgi:hypothetical protein
MTAGLRAGAVLCLGLISAAGLSSVSAAQSNQLARLRVSQDSVNQLFWMANKERASRGLVSLKWDAALAAGAMRHCQRMALAGAISHRYAGEGDVDARAGAAGAHFSLIEENIAAGPYAPGIHQGWMNSPGHRSNLLSPNVDRVGLAVVARGRTLYAVADYSRAVPVLTQAQVEGSVGAQLRAKGMAIAGDPAVARAYCSSPARYAAQVSPSFLMRWQNGDVNELPRDLKEQLASGQYSQAVVGSCPPQGAGSFTAYRVAVLLYGSQIGALPSR